MPMKAGICGAGGAEGAPAEFASRNRCKPCRKAYLRGWWGENSGRYGPRETREQKRLRYLRYRRIQLSASARKFWELKLQVFSRYGGRPVAGRGGVSQPRSWPGPGPGG